MNTLTDRYIAAALRPIPERQRADIERELRASVEDAVEARVAAGASTAAAEEAAVRELGDPERLAARYLDRPRYLIGPAVYRDWARLLRVLLTTVVPIVAVVAVAVRTATGDGAGDVILGAASTALVVALQLCFWTTLAFAAVERWAPGWRGTAAEWTPADLPEIEQSRVAAGELLLWVTMPVLGIVGLIWQQRLTLVLDDGEAVPLLRPENWSFWWPYLMVVMVLSVALALWVWRVGWTVATAGVKVALTLAFAVPAVWLLTEGRAFNPRIFDLLDLGSADRVESVVTTVAVVAVMAAAVGDVIDTVRRAFRQRRLPCRPAVSPWARSSSTPRRES